MFGRVTLFYIGYSDDGPSRKGLQGVDLFFYSPQPHSILTFTLRDWLYWYTALIVISVVVYYASTVYPSNIYTYNVLVYSRRLKSSLQQLHCYTNTEQCVFCTENNDNHDGDDTRREHLQSLVCGHSEPFLFCHFNPYHLLFQISS